MPLRPHLFTLARRAYHHRTFLPSSPALQLSHHHQLPQHHGQTCRTMASVPTASSTSPTPALSPSPSSTPAAPEATPAATTARSAHVEDASPSTTTADTAATATQTPSSSGDGAIPKPLPALPAPGTETESPEGKTTTIVVNGAPISLDALGPMVVNRDGTLARIANWQEMSSFERENTLRILGKRNQLRLATLRGDDGTTEKKG